MTKRQSLYAAINLLQDARAQLLGVVRCVRNAAFYGAGGLSPADVDALASIYDRIGSILIKDVEKHLEATPFEKRDEA